MRREQLSTRWKNKIEQPMVCILRFIGTMLFGIALIVLMVIFPAHGQDAAQTTCQGSYKGKTLSQEQLHEVLAEHNTWRKTKKKDGRQANLCEAKLRQANLEGAKLLQANLAGADLRNANLVKANLFDATLTGANFEKADLTKAILNKAQLHKADLSGTMLHGAKLFKTNLTQANLTQADLTQANLIQADLTKANLRNAKLGHINLTETDLTEAQFQGARLAGAIFEPKAGSLPHGTGLFFGGDAALANRGRTCAVVY